MGSYETHLLLVAGTDHDVAIFTREDLVWNDGRVRRTMASSLCTRDQVVRRDVSQTCEL